MIFPFYARDQWQASHKLTINYGLRWELLSCADDRESRYPVQQSIERHHQSNGGALRSRRESRRLRHSRFRKSFLLPALESPIVWTTTRSCVPAMLCRLPRWKWAILEPRLSRQRWKASTTEPTAYLAAPTTLATGFPTIPNPVPDSHGNVAIPFGAGNVNTVEQELSAAAIFSPIT